MTDPEQSHDLETVRAKKGFTLIEILASMTILVVLILLLTQVYTNGSNAWRIGKRNVDRNMLARSVMDFMARELSMATFDYGPNRPGSDATNFLGFAYFSDQTENNLGLQGSDDVYFVRLNKTPGSGDDGQKRSAELIHYYVDSLDGLKNAPTNAQYRFALFRDSRHPALSKEANEYYPLYLDDLNTMDWMGKTGNARDRPRTPGSILIDNVRTFEVFAYTDDIGTSSNSWSASGSGSKLAFLDIYLETLDEKDAIRAAALAANLGADDSNVVQFVERSVKRNYRRVYLYNKQGYQDKW